MTSARRRFSSSTEGALRRAAALLAFAVLMAALLPAPPLRAQTGQVEEEDITASLGEYRAMLEAAMGLLESLDFAESIDGFTRLIEDYKSGKIPTITPDAGELVAGAYEGRALALANLGRGSWQVGIFVAAMGAGVAAYRFARRDPRPLGGAPDPAL